MNLFIKEKRMALLSIIFFSILFFVLTSCDSDVDINFVQNELPTYNYSVWIYDKNDQLITQNSVIDNKEDLSQIRIFIQNHCSDQINISFLILVNGFMVDIPCDDRTTQVLDFSLESFEERELIIESDLNHIWYDENKISLIFLSESKEYFIDEIEPIKNYTSSLTFTLLSNADFQEQVQTNIYDDKYEINSIDENYPGLSPNLIKEINGNSVNAVIMPNDEKWFTYQPHNIFINTANNDSYNDFLLNLFATEGEYITLLFAEGLPIPAFNDKYYLYWKTDGKSIISANINLSNVNIESLENIFTLTVPLDKANNYIYDSVKTNIYNWDQDSKTETESEKSYFIRLMDMERKVFKPDQDYDYLGGSLTYLYSYHQKIYHTNENHRIMIFVNGIPQQFQVNDNEKSLYYDYLIKPGELVELILHIDPLLENNEKEFNVSVVTLYDCEENKFNESALSSSFEHRMGVHYIIKVNNQLNSLNSYREDNAVFINSFSSKVSENDNVDINIYTDYNILRKALSSGYVFVPSDSDCTIYIDVVNYDVSYYSLCVICNGEYVEFENDKNILLFSIDEDKSIYSFKIEIPKKYIGKNNSLSFIFSKIHKEKLSYNELNYRCSSGIRLSITTYASTDYIQPFEVVLNSSDKSTFVNVNMEENKIRNIYSTTVLADSNKVTNITPRLWFENNETSTIFDYSYNKIILSPFYYMNNMLINSYDETRSIYIAKYKTYREGLTQ